MRYALLLWIVVAFGICMAYIEIAAKWRIAFGNVCS